MAKIKLSAGVYAELDSYADTAEDHDLQAALSPTGLGGTLNLDLLDIPSRARLAQHLDVEVSGGAYDSPNTTRALARLALKLRS